MDHSKHRIERSAGVLLPASSLPSPYGIGAFGEDARSWIDFLRDAGQSFWQTLPLNPVDDTGSPYQSVSAFAGDANYIDLDTLAGEGLLDAADYADAGRSPADRRVGYEELSRSREPVLRKAASRFTDAEALESFSERNRWAGDYALYMTIKASQGGRPWHEWEEPLRARRPGALETLKTELADDVRYHTFTQYQFRRQWRALRGYANARNVRIIGDMPIYVSLDSADVWANPGAFMLGGDLLPTGVAGYPPDALSDYGQLWGNPLYDWEVMETDGYSWWIERLRSSAELYDVTRLDHFRGFESYYNIPYGGAPADGRWIPGPGKRFIDAINREMPDARFIAEDLGFPREEVRELLEYSGFPGMNVLQFAFDPLGDGDNRPYKYGVNTVVYPGTHDNDTVKGWGENTDKLYTGHAMEYMNIRDMDDLPDAMIRAAMQSAADLAIIQMQDWLGLGSEARMNTPSTVGGDNWRWRLRRDDLSGSLAARMAKLTTTYDRA